MFVYYYERPSQIIESDRSQGIVTESSISMKLGRLLQKALDIIIFVWLRAPRSKFSYSSIVSRNDVICIVWKTLIIFTYFFPTCIHVFIDLTKYTFPIKSWNASWLVFNLLTSTEYNTYMHWYDWRNKKSPARVYDITSCSALMYKKNMIVISFLLQFFHFSCISNRNRIFIFFIIFFRILFAVDELKK